jgi:NitT/TauT family transport system substrate-binding protein
MEKAGGCLDGSRVDGGRSKRARAGRARTEEGLILLDWIVAATHSPFLVADQQGYFKKEGLDVTIDGGKGSTYAAVNTASGTYNFGWGDLPSMIKFNAQNPGAPLVVIYQSFDESPLAVVSVKKNGITKPQDLDGKRIAGAPGTAGFDVMNILLKANNAENIKINWLPVAGELYASLLAKGDSDGSSGFTVSQAPVLLSVGIKKEDITMLKFADFGTDLYGPAFFTTKKFADENPETVKAVVRAVNKATIEVLGNPETGLKALKVRDRMANAAMEEYRMGIVRGHMLTKHVLKDGMSVVDMDRMQRTVDQTLDTYSLPKTFKAGDIYTDKFLPPVADRMVKATQ